MSLSHTHNIMIVLFIIIVCIVYHTTKVQRSFLLCFFTSAIGGVGG